MLDGALELTSTRAANVELRDTATCSAQETVVHVTGVQVESRDRACWVEVLGDRALTGASARARNVELLNVATGSAQEAVIHIARVYVFSRDRAPGLMLAD